MHAVDATIPVRFITVAAAINDTMADRRFVAVMLVSFATAVLLLTIVGIAGSVSYAVTMRTREIGIRLAIGATPVGIWLGLERAMLVIVGAGAVAGLAVAWMTSRVLSGLLFGLGTHDVASFGVAAVLVCVAGIGAAAWPALRASRTDPSLSMRAE
jgi:ABC-type antimicrobial peptide transport system permease subunit